MAPKTTKRPRLRRSTDPPGYRLGGEFRAGFPDDPALTPGQRLRIAGWARALTPEDLSDAQRTLLEGFRPPPSSAHRQAERLAHYSASPFWSSLMECQQALVEDPSRHPKVKAAGYPLSVTQLAALVGATRDKIHHWHEIGLLPARRSPGGHRQFYAAAAARAFLLAGMDQPDITVLRELSDRRAGPLLVGMSAVLHEQAASAAPDERELMKRTAVDLQHLGTAFSKAG